MGDLKEKGMHVFDTSIGRCAIGWTKKGIDMCRLPANEDDELVHILHSGFPKREIVKIPPKEIRKVKKRIQGHFKNKNDSLVDIKLDLSSASPFGQKVYKALRKIPPGQTITYGDLAKNIGKPKSARAIGRAMGTNPIPIIIPCHRVLAKAGKPGGFSAPAGISMKIIILHKEGVIFNKKHEKGMRFVEKSNPLFEKIVKNVGPYTAPYGSISRPYESLVNSIMYQQISVKAASSIARKFIAMYGDGKYPVAKVMKELNDAEFREAGVSRQKAGYLRDLATKVSNGDVDLRRISRMDDEKVISELTKIRGIGRWSAQMFLIFHLGRLDIWPVDDLGLQKGVQKVLNLKEKPDKKSLVEIGRRWAPYRSIATWYLWRGQGAGGVLS